MNGKDIKLDDILYCFNPTDATYYRTTTIAKVERKAGYSTGYRFYVKGDLLWNDKFEKWRAL